MLNKLFKLEFTWINKFVPFFATGALILALGSRLTTDLTSVAGLIVHNALQSLAISALVALICNVLARAFVHFKNSLFRSEAYLIRTLPVEKSTLWNSRVLAYISTITLAIAIALIILSILFLNEELWTTIKELFNANTLTIIFMILTILFETVTLGLSIFAGFLIGSKKPKKNLAQGLSIILFYWGAQILLLVFVFLASQFIPSLKTVFSDTSDLSFADITKNFESFFIFSGSFYALFSLMLYFIGKKSLCSGIDVE